VKQLLFTKQTEHFVLRPAYSKQINLHLFWHRWCHASHTNCEIRCYYDVKKLGGFAQLFLYAPSRSAASRRRLPAARAC